MAVPRLDGLRSVAEDANVPSSPTDCIFRPRTWHDR